MTRPRVSSGLTLIEMIAAIAISAVLAVGVMNVLTQLRRPGSHRDHGPHEDATRSLVERDLRCALEVRSLVDRVEFRGYAALQGAERTPTHGPVQVTYSIQEAGGFRWLTRTQRSVGGGAPDTCSDLVDRMDELPRLVLTGPGAATGVPLPGRGRFVASVWTPVPAGLRVEIGDSERNEAHHAR